MDTFSKGAKASSLINIAQGRVRVRFRLFLTLSLTLALTPTLILT